MTLDFIRLLKFQIAISCYCYLAQDAISSVVTPVHHQVFGMVVVQHLLVGVVGVGCRLSTGRLRVVEPDLKMVLGRQEDVRVTVSVQVQVSVAVIRTADLDRLLRVSERYELGCDCAVSLKKKLNKYLNIFLFKSY